MYKPLTASPLFLNPLPYAIEPTPLNHRSDPSWSGQTDHLPALAASSTPLPCTGLLPPPRTGESKGQLYGREDREALPSPSGALANKTGAGLEEGRPETATEPEAYPIQVRGGTPGGRGVEGLRGTGASNLGRNSRRIWCGHSEALLPALEASAPRLMLVPTTT